MSTNSRPRKLSRNLLTTLLTLSLSLQGMPTMALAEIASTDEEAAVEQAATDAADEVTGIAEDDDLVAVDAPEDNTDITLAEEPVSPTADEANPQDDADETLPASETTPSSDEETLPEEAPAQAPAETPATAPADTPADTPAQNEQQPADAPAQEEVEVEAPTEDDFPGPARATEIIRKRLTTSREARSSIYSYTLDLASSSWYGPIYLCRPNWDSYWNSSDLNDLNPDKYTFTTTSTGKVTISVQAIDQSGYTTNLQWFVFDPRVGEWVSSTHYITSPDGVTSETMSLAAGSYDVYIIGNTSSGGYYQIRGSFAATRKSISGAKVSSISAKGYTGKAITPKPTVKLDGKTLKLDRDYTLTYQNNTKIGTARVIIRGKGNYTGSKTVTFKIKRNIAKAKTNKVKGYTYTGKKLCPKPTVKYGSKTLKRGTDYTLSFKNNLNVGTATIVITGKGNYAGTKKITFKIVKRSLAKAKTSKISTKTYSGKALKPKPKVKLGSKTLKLGRDYTLSYKSNYMPGTATVVIKGKGNYKGSKTIKFKIKRGQFYMIRRDTWNFYNQDFDIPFSIYKKVYRSTSQARLVQRYNANVGGCCYGYSTTVGSIARYKSPSAASFKQNGKRQYSVYALNTGARSTTNNMTVLSLIECGQITQYDYRMQRERNSNYNKLGRLATAARNSMKGGTPIVISISGYDYSSRRYVGHAIFPIKIAQSTSSKLVISCYDCNFPGDPQNLVLYRSGSRYTGWAYQADYYNISWNRGVTYTTPSDNLKGMAGGGGVCYGTAAGATLVAASADMKLVAADGTSYTLAEGAALDPEKVVPVEVLGGNPEGGEQLYWVTLDSDRMGFTDLAQDATVSVATDEGGIDVSAAAGSDVVVDMAEGEGTVVVDAAKGSDFQMTFVDESYAGTSGELTVVGKAAGVVVTQRDGDALVVSGASSIDVTEGDASTGSVKLDPSRAYRVSLASGPAVGEGGPAAAAAANKAKKLLVEVLG